MPDHIFENICKQENILKAWKKCRKSGQNSSIQLNKLAGQIRDDTYQPGIARVFSIHKEKSFREVVCSSAADRVAQQAVNLVLTPFFEKIFCNNSYAFRPGRSLLDALEQVACCHKNRYVFGIKADICKFFDEIDHVILVNTIRKYIPDAKVIRLIKKFIKQPVKRKRIISIPKKGVLQGATLSPLLSNVYLQPLDEFACNRFPVIRYADDFLFPGRTYDEAFHNFRQASLLLEGLSLQFNREKTKRVNFKDGFTFLGYSLNEELYIPLKLPFPVSVLEEISI